MSSRKITSAIKVALIGAAGVVIAAIITSASINIFGKKPELKDEPTPAPTSVPSPAPEIRLSYSGRVIDADTRAAIQGAQVLVEVDQDQPEPHLTDSYGYFYLHVPKVARSFRVRVSVAGYAPFDSGATAVRTGTQEIPIVKAPARINNQSSNISTPSKSHASVDSSPSTSVAPAPSASAQRKAQEEEASVGRNASSPVTVNSEELIKAKETLRQAIRDYVAKYGKFDLIGETLNCVDYNTAVAALREINYLAESTGDRAAKEFVEKTSPEGHSFRWEACKK